MSRQQRCKGAASSFRVAALSVQDLIELRANSWVARREVMGPKKIDQVHADAYRDAANRFQAATGQGKLNRSWRAGAVEGHGSYRGGLPQRYAVLSCLAEPAASPAATYSLVLSEPKSSCL